MTMNVSKTISLVKLLFLLNLGLYSNGITQTVSGSETDRSSHDLFFTKLADRWDEGIPLGNGMLGALIWQKNGVLRIALDRADLWDLRSPAELSRPEFKFSWVCDQVKKNDYKPVQELFDVPYERDPYPTKIPAGALELKIPRIDEIESVHLDLQTATCDVHWKSGIHLTTFVHATEPQGWFRIDGLKSMIPISIVPPPYYKTDSIGIEHNDLGRLRYPQPKLEQSNNEITYHQECSKGFSYEVWVGWNYLNDSSLIGCWTIIPDKPYSLSQNFRLSSSQTVTPEMFTSDLETHRQWWNKYWGQSSIQLPDTILENQWYREMYKFGSASRRGAPPITLQATWTADDGKLPPWKGDFHNDLNTQLSYWPAYSSNHLDEETAYLDWLWKNKDIAKHYTSSYFGVDGLNVPGVSTLDGRPMGGWIQYACGLTVSAWLAQHFYLHWRYSMDKQFLETRAYPWIREVAQYLDKIAQVDSTGKRKLPLSSSPEINDNSINAWFTGTTNFDLSLIRWLYSAAVEIALALDKKDDVERWNKILSEWPELATSSTNYKLLVAPGVELTESHRHFSHLLAIYPLGLLDWDRKGMNRMITISSLTDLDNLGTDAWCGYSYSWLGNLWARAHNGDRAAQALKTFATCFCLPNSFHVNGDQSGTGKSKFTYRPFTLEGNFAEASGIQEMLLQSYNGLIRIFPAIPESWKNASFSTLRAEGAFVISANRENNRLTRLSILSEKGGMLKLLNPFAGKDFDVFGTTIDKDILKREIIEIETTAGMEIIFTPSETTDPNYHNRN